MDTEMNGQFEWTESGLSCLQAIQNIIEKNGGNDKMYFAMLEETADNKYQRYKSRLYDNVRTLRRSNVKANVIMDVLSISEPILYKIIKELELE